MRLIKPEMRPTCYGKQLTLFQRALVCPKIDEKDFCQLPTDVWRRFVMTEEGQNESVGWARQCKEELDLDIGAARGYLREKNEKKRGMAG